MKKELKCLAPQGFMNNFVLSRPSSSARARVRLAVAKVHYLLVQAVRSPPWMFQSRVPPRAWHILHTRSAATRTHSWYSLLNHLVPKTAHISLVEM